MDSGCVGVFGIGIASNGLVSFVMCEECTIDTSQRNYITNIIKNDVCIVKQFWIIGSYVMGPLYNYLY